MIGLSLPKKDTKYVIEEYLGTTKVNLTYSELNKSSLYTVLYCDNDQSNCLGLRSESYSSPADVITIN